MWRSYVLKVIGHGISYIFWNTYSICALGEKGEEGKGSCVCVCVDRQVACLVGKGQMF